VKRGKLLYLKHKRFFARRGGALKLLGGVGYAKALPHHFLYIRDLDGGLRNKDVYDSLTLHKPVVVEMDSLSPQVVGALYSLEAHVAFREEQARALSSLIGDKAALLFKGDTSLLPLFKDVFVEACPPPFPAEGKRIFCFGRPWEGAYAVVEE